MTPSATPKFMTSIYDSKHSIIQSMTPSMTPSVTQNAKNDSNLSGIHQSKLSMSHQ